MNSQPTFLFLTNLNLLNQAILSKACKPDNFESHISLKLSATNIQGLRSNFDCESFLESPLLETLLTFLLCVRQIWMTELILAISL